MELNADKITQEELLLAAKLNPAFNDLTDKEFYQMVVMDTARIAVETVTEELKRLDRDPDQEFVLSEAMRLIEELSSLDFHADFKKDCKAIIKGKRLK